MRGKRDQVVLATKCAGKVGPAPWQQGASRQHVLAAIDASLARLGTDHVDLYQIHHFDPSTPMDETLEALDAVVRSGKGALRRCLQLPCLPGRARAGPKRDAGDHPAGVGAAALQHAIPPDRARTAAALRRRGARRHLVQPARGRPAHRQAQAHRAAAGRLALRARHPPGKMYVQRYWQERELDTVEAFRQARGGPRARARHARRGVGAGPPGDHHAPSSARASPSSSRPAWPPSTSGSTRPSRLGSTSSRTSIAWATPHASRLLKTAHEAYLQYA